MDVLLRHTQTGCDYEESFARELHLIMLSSGRLPEPACITRIAAPACSSVKHVEKSATKMYVAATRALYSVAFVSDGKICTVAATRWLRLT
jgi:hypothetical protein